MTQNIVIEQNIYIYIFRFYNSWHLWCFITDSWTASPQAIKKKKKRTCGTSHITFIHFLNVYCQLVTYLETVLLIQHCSFISSISNGMQPLHLTSKTFELNVTYSVFLWCRLPGFYQPSSTLTWKMGPVAPT